MLWLTWIERMPTGETWVEEGSFNPILDRFRLGATLERAVQGMSAVMWSSAQRDVAIERLELELRLSRATDAQLSRAKEAFPDLTTRGGNVAGPLFCGVSCSLRSSKGTRSGKGRRGV